jgi:hypothetical protein
MKFYDNEIEKMVEYIYELTKKGLTFEVSNLHDGTFEVKLLGCF